MSHIITRTSNLHLNCVTSIEKKNKYTSYHFPPALDPPVLQPVFFSAVPLTTGLLCRRGYLLKQPTCLDTMRPTQYVVFQSLTAWAWARYAASNWKGTSRSTSSGGGIKKICSSSRDHWERERINWPGGTEMLWGLLSSQPSVNQKLVLHRRALATLCLGRVGWFACLFSSLKYNPICLCYNRLKLF